MDKENKDSEGVKNGYLLKQKTHCQEGRGFQSQVVSELVLIGSLDLLSL